MPKQHVLILNHSYKSPFKELDVQYARLFSPDRYEVTIAYLTGGADCGETAPSAVYHTIFLNLRKKDIRNLKLQAIRKVRALCEERRVSIAICHRYKPMYVMSWVARSCPIPHLVAVMHDFRTLHRLSHRLFVYLRLRHQFVFAGVSDAVREDLFRDGWGLKAERVITLPNSIDVPEIVTQQLDRASARDRLGLAMDDFVLGTVGRLHTAKDHFTLIQAVAAVAQDRPDIRLVIIGDGDLESALQQAIAQHGLEGRVVLAGFIPHAWRLMRAFDVYLSSSRKEPFGMVLLEAMAASLPIIATAVGGVPQVMGDCGRLVAPGNPDQMADAIRAYARKSPEERIELGQQSRMRLEKNFTTEQFRKVFWDIFSPWGLTP